ncbi:MAG: hypothetical protein AAFQ42_01455 [Pseudomonadota bacterium]
MSICRAIALAARNLVTPRLATAVAAACMCFATSPADAASTYVWSARAGNDDQNGGRYTARLRQQTAEGKRAFEAVCTTRGQNAILEYNTGDLFNLSKAYVTFYRDGREIFAKTGQVYRPRAGDGVAGILFETTIDDRLWDVLSTGNYVRYQVEALGKAGMNLQGAGEAVATFRAECQAIETSWQSYSGTDTANPENNVRADATCSMFGTVKAVDSRKPLSVRFRNETNATRTVMWIDYDGRPKAYRDLAPGESYVQQTYAGHPWMFADGPGNCKELYIPGAGLAGSTYSIRFQD